MLFVGFIDTDLAKVEIDFARLEQRTLPTLTVGVSELGKQVLAAAKARFVDFAGESGSDRMMRHARFSAAHMKAGVITVEGPGGPKAISSVGQTLPRARIVAQQRPDWSQAQYVYGFKPATEQDVPETEMRDQLEARFGSLLSRTGFTP